MFIIFLSFFKTQGFNAIQFIGLKNYIEVFENAWFTSALRNTVLYVLWSIVIGFAIPVFLGLFLSEVIHFKSLFKVMIYLPNMIPGIAIVLIWSFFLSPERSGSANQILQSLGLGSSLWFDDDNLIKPLIIVTLTWRGAGSSALIYLASFQNIDQSLYEASTLDGANSFQKIWYISLPAIMGLIKMMFLLQVISIFQIFYEPLILGKLNRPEAISLMQLVHRFAFVETNKAGHAAALGVMLTFLLIGLSLVYMKITNEREPGKKAGKLFSKPGKEAL